MVHLPICVCNPSHPSHNHFTCRYNLIIGRKTCPWTVQESLHNIMYKTGAGTVNVCRQHQKQQLTAKGHHWQPQETVLFKNSLAGNETGTVAAAGNCP